MSLLRPQLIIDHVTEITPSFLASRGLRGIILDLDNTLVAYGSYEHDHAMQAWASALLKAGVRLYLLSNARRSRVRFWSGHFGFAGKGLASKPIPRGFRKAVRHIGLQPTEVAMVGDQLFTDVLGGNLAGMFTILVRPLADNALPHTKLARRFERLVLSRYQDLLPRPVPSSHPSSLKSARRAEWPHRRS
ncbi:YqeG family HAD IIIA-type phosphatase [Deinococcus yavapaiensis]|uniref:YqeG family HAD IIIA-type phosphatase n=1 Tax=Deinococcus yavapaiensis KR-236 TaxID=694435 RepID=A0A318S4H0_9DEIO|nr:YqeG family HAD IIIA-type phosphatase [Deinococcus yavapaiensis]PYE51870.1 hypothetical protein DES52_11471 [Deinococcus yavapaiensis KR-236]